MENSVNTIPAKQFLTVTEGRLQLSDTTIEGYFSRPFGDEVIWISGIIIFLFFAIGLLLNLVTAIVILKYARLRNLFSYFILSLCISDLLSTLVSPLCWYRRTLGFDEWKIPAILCRVYWSVDIMTNFVTAIHILTFSVLRFLSIKWPFPFQSVSTSTGRILIVVIWLLNVGGGFVPFWIWVGVRERQRYGNSPDARWPACTVNMEWYDQYRLYQKIAYPIAMYIPMIVVTFVSAITITLVYGSSKFLVVHCPQRKRKDKQAVLQLCLIVISFLVGYVPFTAYEFWSVHDSPNTPYTIHVDYHFGLVEYFFIRLSECLNPIFYNIGSAKMRAHTKHFVFGLFGKKVLLKGMWTIKRSSTDNRSVPSKSSRLPEG